MLKILNDTLKNVIFYFEVDIMPKLGQRLRKARELAGLSQLEAAKKLGISNGTLSGYERDYRDPDTRMLEKIANLYEVSTDWLLGLADNPTPPGKKAKPYYELTEKDERDIARDLERIMNDLESDEALAFYGEPMDEETKRLVRLSLEHSMRLAKEMAKKKFTPKKYRGKKNE